MKYAFLLLVTVFLAACGRRADPAPKIAPSVQFKVNAASTDTCWYAMRNGGRSLDLYLSHSDRATPNLFQTMDVPYSASEDEKDANLAEVLKALLTANSEGKCNVYVPYCEVESGTTEPGSSDLDHEWASLKISRLDGGGQDSYTHLISPRDGDQKQNVAKLNARKAKLQKMGACR